MQQQINLYQDRFKEKKIIASARFSAFLVIVLGCALAFGTHYQTNKLVELELKSTQLDAQRESVTNQISQLKTKIDIILADNGLSDKIQDARLKILAAQKIIKFVDRRQFNSSSGFSPQLLALSRLSLKDVWLSEIELSSNYMSLKGSSLNEETIPVYFQGFESESIFKGMNFDVFEILRSDKNEWKVDFVIASHVKDQQAAQ